MSNADDVPGPENIDLLYKQIADLMDQWSDLPTPQVRALLRELLCLLMDHAEKLGLDSQRLLQQAIDRQDSR